MSKRPMEPFGFDVFPNIFYLPCGYAAYQPIRRGQSLGDHATKRNYTMVGNTASWSKPASGADIAVRSY